jgi:hypothetical protein
MSEHGHPPTVLAVPETDPEPQTEPETRVDADPGDEDDQPLRWYVIAAFMATVVAGFGVAVLLTATWFTDCHEGAGTGRSTSFAGDSTRATLCESGHGAAGLLIPGGWVVGLALATWALSRWGGGGIRAVLLAALLLTPAALPAAASAGLGLSGMDCASDERAAYRAWADDGSKGTPPYDCRKF